MHPADELAEIRDALRILKTREVELRAKLATQRDDLCGRVHRVVFKSQRHRVFVKERLPSELLDQPDLWETHESFQMNVERVAAPQEEDYDVIEPWPELAESRPQ